MFVGGSGGFIDARKAARNEGIAAFVNALAPDADLMVEPCVNIGHLVGMLQRIATERNGSATGRPAIMVKELAPGAYAVVPSNCIITEVVTVPDQSMVQTTRTQFLGRDVEEISRRYAAMSTTAWVYKRPQDLSGISLPHQQQQPS